MFLFSPSKMNRVLRLLHKHADPMLPIAYLLGRHEEPISVGVGSGALFAVYTINNSTYSGDYETFIVGLNSFQLHKGSKMQRVRPGPLPNLPQLYLKVSGGRGPVPTALVRWPFGLESNLGVPLHNTETLCAVSELPGIQGDIHLDENGMTVFLDGADLQVRRVFGVMNQVPVSPTLLANCREGAMIQHSNTGSYTSIILNHGADALCLTERKGVPVRSPPFLSQQDIDDNTIASTPISLWEQARGVDSDEGELVYLSESRVGSASWPERIPSLCAQLPLATLRGFLRMCDPRTPIAIALVGDNLLLSSGQVNLRIPRTRSEP